MQDRPTAAPSAAQASTSSNPQSAQILPFERIPIYEHDRAAIRRLQREIAQATGTSLDFEKAKLLYFYRAGGASRYFYAHEFDLCEALEDRLAKLTAERALGDLGHNDIDWDRLDEQRRAAPQPQPVPAPPRPRAQQQTVPAPLGEWDAGDDPGIIPPRQWLLANQFCRAFISSIVAAGGAGKSALRLLQFISMATGRALCGQYVFKRCRVLLISLEDDRDELQRRIKAVIDHYDIPRHELKGWLFCASPKLAKLAEMQNRTRIIGPLEQQLRDAIARCKPDIISLDPFIKTHALEENNSGDMDFVCDLLARIGVEFNIAVDSPHHVHKGTLVPGDADSGRGSSGIKDAGRLVYTLTPMSEDEATTFNINADDRHSYVRLDSAKVNIAARSGKPTWFRLVAVPLGNTTAEYPNGDTVQTVEPWTPPDTWAGLDSELLNRILTAIDAGLGDGNFYTAANSATDRAAWRVIQRFAPEKTEGQARKIIAAWLASGLLVKFDYTNPITYQPVKGLKVDATKRPI
jgi:AAA domain